MSVFYKSAFAGDIRDYIDLKCALGYSASTYDCTVTLIRNNELHNKHIIT